jgi:hypothetical protein
MENIREIEYFTEHIQQETNTAQQTNPLKDFTYLGVQAYTQ